MATMQTFTMRGVMGRVALGAAFGAIVAAGCGGGSAGTGGSSSSSSGSGGNPSTTSSSSSSGTGGGSNAVACPSQPADHVSLGGTWAAYGQLNVKLQGTPGGAITICPADQVGAATLLVMLDIQENATDPTKLDKVQATVCSIELPVVTALVGQCDPTSGGLVSTQLVAPQTFIDALPKVASMPASGMLSGSAVGSTVALGPLDVSVGSTKSGANLPKWDTASQPCSATGIGTTSCDATCVSDCASMRDDDMDNLPGVTIDVCGYTPDDTKAGVQCHADDPSTPGATLQGKAFIAIEVNPTFSGTTKSSCELVGTVDTQVLYSVVGADVRLGGGPVGVTAAIKSLPTFQVDPATSKFRMVRVDGKFGAPDWQIDPTMPSAACKTINMRVNEL
jgi:hypothetical protein